MIKLVQQIFARVYCFCDACYTVNNTFGDAIYSIKMYDNPTLCQRLGVGKAREVQFAYQKAESRFDNYSIRAIIRDERF